MLTKPSVAVGGTAWCKTSVIAGVKKAAPYADAKNVPAVVSFVATLPIAVASTEHIDRDSGAGYGFRRHFPPGSLPGTRRRHRHDHHNPRTPFGAVRCTAASSQHNGLPALLSNVERRPGTASERADAAAPSLHPIVPRSASTLGRRSVLLGPRDRLPATVCFNGRPRAGCKVKRAPSGRVFLCA